MARVLFVLLGCCGFIHSYVDAAIAPNQLLGTCLDDDWVKSVESKYGIDHTARDSLGRLQYPFLHTALRHRLHDVVDSRTAAKGVFDPSCMPASTMIYGVGATVDAADGSVINPGSVNGTLILELSGWISHSLSTLVFAILAAEVYGYGVSLYYTTDTLFLTQRMSSIGQAVCTPSHANMEVWTAGIEAALQVYSNESFPAGGVGYYGRSGLYTTTDFVQQSVNTSIHPTPLFADFWKGYKYFPELIEAVPVSSLRNNSKFFPPSEVGCVDDSYGCLNHCSRTPECTEYEAQGKECMVVAMMYDFFDPGYLQAVMSNIGIPTYFCFMGYTAVQDYALEQQKNNQPVLFYHYEPDLIHYEHPDLFQRVFLPRSVPERVSLATGSFGEHGYGNKTDNPVDVDFPTTKLVKYTAILLQNQQPIGELLSQFTLQELDINSILRAYLNVSSDDNEQDPVFTASCTWVRENYNVWSLWMDRLPICTFDAHIEYDVTGCDEEERVVMFKWVVADPDNASLPYNCDGGMTNLPDPLHTSRSCEWILVDSSEWRDWIVKQPECDESFYKYNITECDSSAKRRVKYWWLLPNMTDLTQSLECSGGVELPADVTVACEYMPTSSPKFFVVLATAIILIVLQVAAIAFVFIEREKPIVKRSQYELLILMIIGGILVCVAAIVYAGKPTVLLCAARPLTISLGFTTIFGSLFVKSLRVYRVFMRSAMKRVKISMTMMLKVFAVFLGVDVLILTAWYAVDFPGPTSTTISSRDFSGNIDQVTCKSTSFIYTAILMFWKAIVLLAGLYLSFLIRNVSVDFQESVWIFGSSLMVLIACLFVLPLAYLVEMTYAIFYVFLAFAFLLSTAIVMGMMLTPKLLRLNEAAKSSRYSSDTGITGGRGPGAGDTASKLTAKGSSTVVAQSRGSATALVRTSVSGAAVRPTTVGDTDSDYTHTQS